MYGFNHPMCQILQYYNILYKIMHCIHFVVMSIFTCNKALRTCMLNVGRFNKIILLVFKKVSTSSCNSYGIIKKMQGKGK